MRKKVISKSKIRHINIMLMLKITKPNNNLFFMNIVPYLFRLCFLESFLETLLDLHFEEDYSKEQHHYS